MNIGGVSPAQLQEMQRLYDGKENYSSYPSAHDSTADGRYRLEVSYLSGSCMTAGSSSIDAFERGPGMYYHYESHSGVTYSNPTISPDGSLGYVQRERRGERRPYYSICQVSLRPHGKPHKLHSVKRPCGGLTLSPDQTLLAYGQGREIRGWDCQKGFFRSVARRLHWQSEQVIATLPEEVSSVHFLSDGTLAAMPDRWRKACYLVQPGSVTRVPMRAVWPEHFRQEVRQALPFLKEDQVEAFADQPGGIVDDEAKVRPNVWAQRSSDKMVAMVVAEDNRRAALYTWDGAVTRRVADIPTDDARGFRLPLFSAGGALMMVGHSKADDYRLTVVDMTSGRVCSIPNAGGRDPLLSPDGGCLGVVAESGLWEYDRQSASARLLCQMPPATGNIRTTWTPDSQFLVAWYRRDDRWVVAVGGRGGSASAIIPLVENVELEENTLRLRVCDEDHEVTLPADLATLAKQDWYQRACSGAILGQQGSQPDKDLHIEREADHVDLGGVTVPVRH